MQVAVNPNNLLNASLRMLKLKNDAQLARKLGIDPPILSRIRHHRLPVGAMLLIRLNELTGLTIQELRALMGDLRPSYTGAIRCTPQEKQAT